MKKIIYFSLTLILGLVLSSTTCSKMDAHDEYLGTWKWTSGGGGVNWYIVTLTESELIYENHVPYKFVMTNLKWTPISNPSGPYKSSHPTGYKITGKLKSNTFPTAPLKADESGTANVGDNAVIWFYISTDKKSLCQGDREKPSREGNWDGFVKQ